MSRIDYITVGLVALCLAALIYILSKVAGLEQSVTPQIPEELPSTVAAPLDSMSRIDSIPPGPDTLPAVLPQKEEETPVGIGTEKRYLVVAASFPEASLAQKEQERLTNLGYTDCEIGYFNQRKIVSVIAGRFADYEQASAFAEKMNQTHQLKAYVHEKRLR